ncbi:hypothetical protein J6590_008472 [Homalodisca vitripennis]|nr:hypothetical protein J6590_008472 [Homalodisca vitripennis]
MGPGVNKDVRRQLTEMEVQAPTLQRQYLEDRERKSEEEKDRRMIGRRHGPPTVSLPSTLPPPLIGPGTSRLPRKGVRFEWTTAFGGTIFCPENGGP